MPVYAAMFVLFTMASVGVPGTNGFVGEFMVILSTIQSQALGQWALSQSTVAACGVILAAVYMLSVVQKVFFGPLDNPKNKDLEDLNTRESIALAPLAALVFAIGLFPNVMLSRMHESVAGVVERYVQGQDIYHQHEGQTEAALKPLLGGPTESGYPAAPKKEGGTPSVALRMPEAP
jgi:NADH-quinone oxidoreductase subunit M